MILSDQRAGACLFSTLLCQTAFLGAVVLAAPCRADTASAVVYEGVSFDLVVSPLGNVGHTPLKALRVAAVGKGGALPSTFDSTKGGFPGPAPGITTAGNGLHQVWEFDGGLMTPTLFLEDQADPIPLQLDSHLLVNEGPNGDVHPWNLPYEDMVPGSPEDPRGGFGSFLRATVFLRPGYETPTWGVAYLVVPAGTDLGFDFEIAGTRGEFEDVVASYRVMLGDMDFSGRVDFDDISPFVLALNRPAAYVDQFGLDPVVYGDLDQDGDVDFDDIPVLLGVLAATSADTVETAVPEPTTCGLLLLAVFMLATAVRPRTSRSVEI